VSKGELHSPSGRRLYPESSWVTVKHRCGHEHRHRVTHPARKVQPHLIGRFKQADCARVKRYAAAEPCPKCHEQAYKEAVAALPPEEDPFVRFE